MGLALAEADAPDNFFIAFSDSECPSSALQPIESEEIRPTVHSKSDITLHGAGFGQREQLIIVRGDGFAYNDPID